MKIERIKPPIDDHPVVRCELTQAEVNCLSVLSSHVSGTPGTGQPRTILDTLFSQFERYATTNSLHLSQGPYIEGAPCQQ